MTGVSMTIILSILMPLLGIFGNIFLRQHKNLRDTFTFLVSVLTFSAVFAVFLLTGGLQQEELSILTVLPNLDIAFKVEPIGLLFALVASGLWMLTHLYGIGYMRGTNEDRQAQFFAFFCVAIFAVMGICFAANMFTLFIFYEILTLSTYPLVAHKGDAKSVSGARVYLGMLLGTSIVFLLTALIWTYVLVGHLDFMPGGILKEKIEVGLLPLLLGLYAFGIGKAALMPLHRWLPAAMVAPTPVSALLHAVAVVKAGVFTILKVGVYIFGLDFLAESGASQWLIWLAAISIILASIFALMQDNLKKRLAYSTVSQLSYITLAMALATPMAAVGGGMHIAMHAFGKIALFMCAGAIYVATNKTEISDMSGLGKTMPITFTIFAIASFSIIGLPPFGGSWSKFLLFMGAIETEYFVIILVLMISSLLNVAYLLPIVGRGFFINSGEGKEVNSIKEAPLLCWLPAAIAAIACILLFFYAGLIQDFLLPIVGGSL